MTPFVARPRLPLVLSGLAAYVALAAAALGLADLDLYRPMTPEHLIPGTVSQDLMTLAVALALIALGWRLRRHDDRRLWLIWLGCLGYIAYAYAIYAFETVINPLYPAYLAAFSLALWAVIAFFARVGQLGIGVPRPPRKTTAALFVLLSGLFAVLWSSILIPAMASRTPPEGATIFVLDLTFVLPLLGLGAVLLWRARPMGDLIAVPLLIKAATIGLSVLVGTALGPAFGQPVMLADIVTYAILGLLPLVLVWPWLNAIPSG